MRTLRSMLASWSGQGSGASQPLFDVHREFILQSSVLHADETPVRLLDPGAGKTKRASVWAYASSKFDPLPGVAYDFCLGRSCKYAVAFLGDWCVTNSPTMRAWSSFTSARLLVTWRTQGESSTSSSGTTRVR